jgi:hypothetical protein
VLDLVEVLGLLHNGEDQPPIRNRKGVTAGGRRPTTWPRQLPGWRSCLPLLIGAQ